MTASQHCVVQCMMWTVRAVHPCTVHPPIWLPFMIGHCWVCVQVPALPPSTPATASMAQGQWSPRQLQRRGRQWASTSLLGRVLQGVSWALWRRQHAPASAALWSRAWEAVPVMGCLPFGSDWVCLCHGIVFWHCLGSGWGDRQGGSRDTGTCRVALCCTYTAHVTGIHASAAAHVGCL